MQGGGAMVTWIIFGIVPTLTPPTPPQPLVSFYFIWAHGSIEGAGFQISNIKENQ